MQALSGTHLYPITDRSLSGLSHAEQVVLLSDCGVTLIQLREKVDSPSRFLAQAEAALRVARQRGVKIIINDRVDIALSLRADGVHLGQEDLPPDAARRILGNAAIIGFSTHNLEQARLAARMPLDYLAIGPIFATTTKVSQNPPMGLEGLRRARQALGTIPLVAIGGISGENVAAVREAGVDVVAVISDIWEPAAEAPTRIKRLLNLSEARPVE